MTHSLKLGTPGCFQKSLLKLQIIEQLKLIDGDSVFAVQCRLGAADPAFYNEIIENIVSQYHDNSEKVTEVVGDELVRMVFKYSKL